MISEYEKLLDMVTKLSPSVKEMSISLKRITPGLLADGERSAERDVRKDGLPGRVIARRFATRTTDNTPWVARKVFGDGHPLLRITGDLMREAISKSNEQFKLDNTGLNVFDMSGKAQGLNNGTFPGAAGARPFYAPFTAREQEPIFDFAEGRIVIFVCAKAGLR